MTRQLYQITPLLTIYLNYLLCVVHCPIHINVIVIIVTIIAPGFAFIHATALHFTRSRASRVSICSGQKLRNKKRLETWRTHSKIYISVFEVSWFRNVPVCAVDVAFVGTTRTVFCDRKQRETNKYFKKLGVRFYLSIMIYWCRIWTENYKNISIVSSHRKPKLLDYKSRR